MTAYDDGRVTLHHGDCLDVLRTLPDASVDAVVTDPPYGLGFMGKEWDTPGAFVERKAEKRNTFDHVGGNHNPSNAADAARTRRVESRKFGEWCELWTAECLRVLKPGGHLLAFGGTRTWHRLACAVEDAGFEIRDSIAWMYGSGFPKSLDVSKAIDKAAGAEREVVGVRTLLGRAAQSPKEKGGTYTAAAPSSAGMSKDVDITAPATDDARTWQGWGTALKPAWESCVVAQKPLPHLAKIGSHLDALEQSCKQPANDAVPSSAPIPADSLEATTASALGPAATQPVDDQERQTPTGAADGSSAATDTSWSEWMATTSSSIVTSWRSCWAALSEPTSTSTTETTSSTTIDLTTLWSCLSRITGPSTLLDPTSPDGLSSLARAADALFAAAVLSSNATRTLTATGLATSPTLDNSQAGGGLDPIVVARKPLTGTVAANVLTHGTGALNIDGCRIGAASGLRRPERRGKGDTGGWATYQQEPGQYGTPDGKGRWPANVVLDESQAAALDQMSGESAPKPERSGRKGGSNPNPMDWETKHTDQTGTWPGDNGGGASRFMYVAKADASERVRVPIPEGDEERLGGQTTTRCVKCGKQRVNVGTSACVCPEPEFVRERSRYISHPTVKPLALMRWLVRLVTPPGGTVLEPFAGSGTTVEACILEGFSCIAIEREADYLPLIQQRINRRRDPVEAVRGAGEDGGLFDLLEPETPAVDGHGTASGATRAGVEAVVRACGGEGS